MHIGRLAALTPALLALGLLLPATASAQQLTPHARAKAEVEAHDKKTHNKLKTEGVPTATGAVAGGVAAGPAGAFAGAKVGHTIGSVFHGVKKHEDIKHTEKRDAQRRRIARAHAVRTRTTARRRVEGE